MLYINPLMQMPDMKLYQCARNHIKTYLNTYYIIKCCFSFVLNLDNGKPFNSNGIFCQM